MIDQNRDGFIDKIDLKDTYASLGKGQILIIMQYFVERKLLVKLIINYQNLYHWLILITKILMP